jgi:hypothetical protein
MATELDLDDVAAQSEKAKRELEHLRDMLTATTDALDYLQGMTPQQAASLRADADRWRWLVRHASLGFDAAPSWNAVVRLPVFDGNDQTITALVDRARAVVASA